MRKLLILITSLYIVACSDTNDFIYNDYWDNKISGLEKSEFSVTDVMLSAECWYGSMNF